LNLQALWVFGKRILDMEEVPGSWQQ